MKGIRVLVAEDDANIRNGLIDTLESEGYDVTATVDGEQALRAFAAQSHHLVLLDVMMPGKSGYDVCREIRAVNREVPVIMLTAKGEEVDKVVGLQLGADDYVTKPFGVHELLARLEAVLRRSGPRLEKAADKRKDPPQVFRFGAADVDARQFTARRGRKSFELSAREVALLQYFHAHPGAVLSRDELLNAVWGIHYYGTTRTLDQHIAQLRKKVELKPAAPVHIETVHGVGYRYRPDRQE
jgi:DNA-binding response OmpR family regulator